MFLPRQCMIKVWCIVYYCGSCCAWAHLKKLNDRPPWRKKKKNSGQGDVPIMTVNDNSMPYCVWRRFLLRVSTFKKKKKNLHKIKREHSGRGDVPTTTVNDENMTRFACWTPVFLFWFQMSAQYEYFLLYFLMCCQHDSRLWKYLRNCFVL